MKLKIAINGFGRIGRNAFKIAAARDDMQVVAINDLGDTKTLAYLLKHDSNYGTYGHDISFDEDHLIVDKHPVKVLAEKDPSQLPWADLGIDVVIESTGRFTTPEDLKLHLDAGAKKVVLSAPEKTEHSHDTFVFGANDEKLDADHKIISNASCTTNSIAPVMAVLVDKLGVDATV